MAFDEHRVRPLLDDGERTGEYRSGLAAGIDEDEMDRLRQRRALRGADHGTVAHEGRVERDRDIVGGHDPTQMGEKVAIACRQRLRHGADGQPRLEARKIGEFRHQGAVDEHDAARLNRGEHGERVFGARLRRRVGHGGERLGVAHERAQVGIFPFFDAAMGQPLRLETPERRLPARRNGVIGQPATQCRKRLCEMSISSISQDST